MAFKMNKPSIIQGTAGHRSATETHMKMSALKKPMKDFALNSQARKDEYDRRGWAHDDTSAVTPKAQPVKDTSKIETKAGTIEHAVRADGGAKAKTTSKPSSNSNSTKPSTKPKATVKPADPTSESETQKNFKGYQGGESSIQNAHKKAADDGAKREAQRKQDKKRSKETTWGDDVGSTTSRDGSDYSATSTDTTKRRGGSTKVVERGLSDGLNNQGKRTKKTTTDSKGKVKKVVTYDEKTGKRTGKVKYDKDGNVKLSRKDKRKKEEATSKAKVNKAADALEKDIASSTMKKRKTN